MTNNDHSLFAILDLSTLATVSGGLPEGYQAATPGKDQAVGAREFWKQQGGIPGQVMEIKSRFTCDDNDCGWIVDSVNKK